MLFLKTRNWLFGGILISSMVSMVFGKIQLKRVFTKIYRNNGWKNPESHSGSGSGLAQTQHLRAMLPELVKRLGVKSILDAPCGDFFWMSRIQLPGVSYQGVDIVTDLINKNKVRYGNSPDRIFMQRNIIGDVLPYADLIVCRDCLVHLSFKDALAVLKNFKKTGAKYLLTTTFVRVSINNDAESPYWRPLNLMKFPFNFPKPLFLINEKCTEKNGKYADKSLGLWLLSDLNI